MKNNIKTGLVLLLILFMVSTLSACQKQNKDNKPLFYVPYGINNSVGENQVYGEGKYNPEFVLTFGYASDPDEKATVLIDDMTNICYRNTGVEFAEGQKFAFEFNGVTVTQEFHANDGDACVFVADFGGCVAEVCVLRNGDFRYLFRKQISCELSCELEPIDRTKMTPEELETRWTEIVSFYNRNLITGEPIVDLDEYEPSLYYDTLYEKIGCYLKMPRKNGWWINEGILVGFNDFVLPNGIIIKNPGHYDNCSVPDAVDDLILEEKLTPLLKQCGLISEDEGILLQNNGFPPGTPSIELSSLTDGTMGLLLRIHISKNGEWTGATQFIFVPFETLGLN